MAALLLAVGGAAAGEEPGLQREQLPGDAQVTYTVVDPLVVPIDAGVAGGDACIAAADAARGCNAGIGQIVRQRGAALGFTANYSGGGHILGLAVVDHRQVSARDPHTTTLCVGDAADGQRPPVSIGKDADATRCRTAASGERIVAGGAPAIEGLGDDGVRGRFWWSVEHYQRVERTLVGLRGDGTLLVAVATSVRTGVRNGMSVVEAAAWMVAHGVVDAIAFDGGHQVDVYSAEHGSEVPLERGEPTLQMAFLLGHVLPAPAPASPAPSDAAVPGPAATPAVPEQSLSGRSARRRVDGVQLDTGAAATALATHLGGPALPESGLAGSAQRVQSIAGDGPAPLDARWLMAAHVGHPLPDVDNAPAPPALPESGAVMQVGG